MTQLKPCPFCGSDKVRLMYWDFWPDGNKSRKVAKGVFCINCECEVLFFTKGTNIGFLNNKDSEEKITEQWNKRT